MFIELSCLYLTAQRKKLLKNKGLCNNYQEGEGGAEKLELFSKNLDSNPRLKQKKISYNPPLLC